MLRYESLLKTITVECKTVINALLLHINSFQIVMLESLMFIFIHSIHFFSRTSWSWLYGIWDYNYTFTIKVVSSNPAHGEVDSMQYYVIKFVSDLRQAQIFFKVAIKTITYPPISYLMSETVQLIYLVKQVGIYRINRKKLNWHIYDMNFTIYKYWSVCLLLVLFRGCRGRDRISN